MKIEDQILKRLVRQVLILVQTQPIYGHFPGIGAGSGSELGSNNLFTQNMSRNIVFSLAYHKIPYYKLKMSLVQIWPLMAPPSAPGEPCIGDISILTPKHIMRRLILHVLS